MYFTNISQYFFNNKMYVYFKMIKDSWVNVNEIYNYVPVGDL